MRPQTVALVFFLSACGSDGVSSSQDGGSGNDGASTRTDSGPPVSGSLSEQYPGDVGLADDDAVIFFDDFESGWGRWDGPSADTKYLTIEDDSVRANAGTHFLRSTVTFDDLAEDQYISSSTRVSFDQVD